VKRHPARCNHEECRRNVRLEQRLNGLIRSPTLLLLDEPSLGLAPPLVSEALGRIQQISRDSGVTVSIVEQKVREVLKMARRVYVLRTGRVSFTGPAEELKDDAKLRAVYL